MPFIEGRPAAKAGMKKGDIILALDGNPLTIFTNNERCKSLKQVSALRLK